MSDHRNAYLDSALFIVKGSVCFVTQLPMSRTTKSVKFLKGNEAIITLAPVTQPFTLTQQEEIKNCVEQKILEDAPFHILLVPRLLAESFYGDLFLDDFGIPSDLTEYVWMFFGSISLISFVCRLRLVVLKEWIVNCSRFPTIRSTGLLKRICIQSFKYNEKKKSVQISISVQVYNESDLQKDCTLCEKRITLLEDLYPFSVGTASTKESNDKGVSQIITPWTVETETEKGVDYDRLIQCFGCSKITETLITRIENLTKKKAHYLLRRGFFFSHRDLDQLLNAYENNRPFYLYTGRGPSSESLHIGHLIPFMFTKYLQDAFNVPLIIQLSDDEKFLFKEDLSLEDVEKLALENIKDIIGMGFDPEKTLIIMSSRYMGYMYKTVLEIQKKVTYNQMRGIFGFQPFDNVGKLLYPAVQAALAFSNALPTIFGSNRKNVWCLIPQAIDQDPYFRMARDVAPRLGYLKPALIHSKFIPALQGLKTKMCGSVHTSSIYCTDTPQEIKTKINKYAYSGGCSTREEHRLHGANLDVDVPIQYLTCFMKDDAELERIKKDYQTGKLLTGEVKAILINVLTEIIQEHQARRAKVTNETIAQCMSLHRDSFNIFKDSVQL
ncbi:tryptophan--tRNA ligase, cytoplasmic-like [Hylaeus volcanicus]|uniref:tryptophan--tRNA ligase, cytoplasmic-like n=1 Tax=Hylaeus volcanicus TaxID=313075 RepID=UPI0023B7C23B|nr:tryptophan--tRNA ligase, cytoplasmic-like [Hylaeus volcanicus]